MSSGKRFIKIDKEDVNETPVYEEKPVYILVENEGEDEEDEDYEYEDVLEDTWVFEDEIEGIDYVWVKRWKRTKRGLKSYQKKIYLR
ncbi:MAG: hypothetical protein GY909_15490 [Oligoflexia bacterium]|nr:hypothetical protein [Oligoflexia bacterium]